MFKKIFVIGALVALTGCASPYQSNQALGTIVGGALGHATGMGPTATALGMIVGAEAGRNTPVYGYPPVNPYYGGGGGYYPRTPVCYLNQHRYNQLANGCETNFMYNRDHYTRHACMEAAQGQATICN